MIMYYGELLQKSNNGDGNENFQNLLALYTRFESISMKYIYEVKMSNHLEGLFCV